MPITKEIDREAIRLLAIEHGVREAARMTGLNEDRVRQWSSRYNWLQARTPHDKEAVTNVTTLPADAHLHELQTHERETRLSLARSARKLASEAEGAELSQAGNVHKAAQVAGIVHKWNDQAPGVQFSLNVLNLNMLSEDSPDTDS